MINLTQNFLSINLKLPLDETEKTPAKAIMLCHSFMCKLCASSQSSALLSAP